MNGSDAAAERLRAIRHRVEILVDEGRDLLRDFDRFVTDSLVVSRRELPLAERGDPRLPQPGTQTWLEAHERVASDFRAPTATDAARGGSSRAAGDRVPLAADRREAPDSLDAVAAWIVRVQRVDAELRVLIAGETECASLSELDQPSTEWDGHRSERSRDVTGEHVSMIDDEAGVAEAYGQLIAAAQELLALSARELSRLRQSRRGSTAYAQAGQNAE